MKLFVKILLLVLAFSTVVFAQTKSEPKVKSERIFIEYLFPRSFSRLKTMNWEERLELQVAGDKKIIVAGVTDVMEEGVLIGSKIDYSLINLTENSAIVGFAMKLQINSRKPIFIEREIFIKKDEVVEIAFKNGIKVRAYFESAKNIIK